MVFPELAGIGAAPQSAANDASVRSRSGLSPAVISRVAVRDHAEAFAGEHRGRGLGGQGAQFGVDLGDFLGEGVVPAG